ncbi:MAG: metallophosphoesterase, partial [Aggregatilineales bacterium]
MTTFIGLPDLHDQAEWLKKIGRPLAMANVVLLAGDMTNGSMNHLLRMFSILSDFNEQVYAVPGNMDTAQVLAYLAREGMSLHRRFELVDGI